MINQSSRWCTWSPTIWESGNYYQSESKELDLEAEAELKEREEHGGASDSVIDEHDQSPDGEDE